jgi:regulatory protein
VRIRARLMMKKRILKGNEMKISSIQKNGVNDVSVYIDEKYSFSIDQEDYVKLGLYSKKEITNDELINIKKTLDLSAAKSFIIRYLSLRTSCENQIRVKLRKADYSGTVIDKTIDYLKSMGYINDKLYVQKFINDRMKLKQKSKKMLKYELKRKGISEDIITNVLDEWKIDEFSIAKELTEKKFGKYDLSNEKIINKIYSFLGNRGFNIEIIQSVLKNIIR